MPRGRHRFEFVGKEPLAFRISILPLFVNTFLMLSLESGGKYFLPDHIPPGISWYADHSMAVQFILLGILTTIFILYRKRVRYFRRR
jgi:hypothetical protein